MATVGALMDRIFSEWLYQIGDRPVQAEITNNPLASGDLSVTLADQLTPEEQSLMTANAIGELDSELVRVTDFNVGTRVATIKRQQYGTAAASHVVGTLFLVEPKYTRQKVMAALGDEIVGLYPELWQVATIDTVLDSVTELPADAEGFLYARDFDGFNHEGDFLTGYGGVDTGRAVRFVRDEAAGQVAWLAYQKGFTRPTAETQELSVLGVEDSWQQLLIISTVSVLIRGREFDLANLEYLTEAIEASSLRIGAPTDVATNLLRYRQLLMSRARTALINRIGIPVVTTRVI